MICWAKALINCSITADRTERIPERGMHFQQGVRDWRAGSCHWGIALAKGWHLFPSRALGASSANDFKSDCRCVYSRGHHGGSAYARGSGSERREVSQNPRKHPGRGLDLEPKWADGLYQPLGGNHFGVHEAGGLFRRRLYVDGAHSA
jgi:hypothetical protein